MALLTAGLIGGAIGGGLAHGYARGRRGALWRIIEGLTWPVKTVLDIIGMPSRVVTGVAWSAASGKRLDKSIWDNLTGEDRRDFIDVLGKMGMQKGWARGGLGTLLNIGTDPIIYSRLFSLTKLGRAVKAIDQTDNATLLGRLGIARRQAATWTTVGGAANLRRAKRLTAAANLIDTVRTKQGIWGRLAVRPRYGADAYALGQRALLQMFGKPLIRGVGAAKWGRQAGLAVRGTPIGRALGKTFIRGYEIPKIGPSGALMRKPMVAMEASGMPVGREVADKFRSLPGYQAALSIQNDPPLVQGLVTHLASKPRQWVARLNRFAAARPEFASRYVQRARALMKLPAVAANPQADLALLQRVTPLADDFSRMFGTIRRYGRMTGGADIPELAEQALGTQRYVPQMVTPGVSGAIRYAKGATRGWAAGGGATRAIRAATQYGMERQLRGRSPLQLAFMQRQQLAQRFGLGKRGPELIAKALKPGQTPYAWRPLELAAVYTARTGAGIGRARAINAIVKKWGRIVPASTAKEWGARGRFSDMNWGAYQPEPDLQLGVFKELSGKQIAALGPKAGRLAVMPRPIADQLNRVISFQNKDVSYFLQGLDKITSWWKRGTLLPWPQYHARNFVQDHYLSWLGGGFNPKNTVRAGQLVSRWGRFKKALNTFRSPGGETKANYQRLVQARRAVESWRVATPQGQMSGLQFLAEAKRGGVREGFVATELGIAGARESALARRLSKVQPFSRNFWPFTKGAKMGEMVNDTTRLSHMITRVEKGDSIATAIGSVKRWLYDYAGGLTVTERRVMRRAFPFYSWMRLNAESMMRLAVTRPGHLSALEHAMRGAESLSEPMPKRYRPSWMAKAMGVQVSNRGGVAGFLLMGSWAPLADLYRLRSPAQLQEYLLESANPAVKVPLEQAMNYQTRFSKPIERFQGEQTTIQMGPLRVPVGTRQAHILYNLRAVSEFQKISKMFWPKGRPVRGTVPFVSWAGVPSYYRLDVAKQKTSYYFRLVGEKRELTRAHRMATSQGRSGYAGQLAERIRQVDEELAREPAPPSRRSRAAPILPGAGLPKLKVPKLLGASTKQRAGLGKQALAFGVPG